MRKINLLFLISLFLCFFSCASSKPVARISVEKQKDLSGNWNDNDIRIVCDSIIDECINSNYIKKGNYTIRKCKSSSLQIVNMHKKCYI